MMVELGPRATTASSCRDHDSSRARRENADSNHCGNQRKNALLQAGRFFAPTIPLFPFPFPPEHHFNFDTQFIGDIKEDGKRKGHIGRGSLYLTEVTLADADPIRQLLLGQPASFPIEGDTTPNLLKFLCMFTAHELTCPLDYRTVCV